MIYNKETLKTLPVHSSILPPSIVTFRDQRWAIFTGGGTDRMIDDEVELEDVHNIWRRKEFEKKPTNIPEPTKSWNVPGSKGNTYEVSIRNESFSCTCPGYAFTRHCKHIQSIKDKYNED